MTRYYREVIPIGEKIGLVTVKQRSHLYGEGGYLYICICECGTEILRTAERIIAGNAYPCKACVKKYNLRYGETFTQEYDIYYN